MLRRVWLLCYSAATWLGCSPAESATDDITYKSDVTPVTDAADALPGVFIPPFVDCRAPLDTRAGQGPGEQVCSNVAISGATQEGRYYPDYASCAIVLTQRPYRPLPPAATTAADDPRLDDAGFMDELAWAKQQLEATACTCCHDSRTVPAAQWDLNTGPIWLDSLSDTGLAEFSGLADSSVLGAYPAQDNYGFDREIVGVPTTDPPRMKALMLQELSRRGLSVEWAKSVPPFGGPIVANYLKKPGRCSDAEGVDAQGVIHFPGEARYVYVLEDGTKNPGVPPNLDLPEGTLWRLDVLPSEPTLRDGFRYGTTPAGSYQHTPPSKPAPQLFFGKKYHFVVIQYVGLTAVNCSFEL